MSGIVYSGVLRNNDEDDEGNGSNLMFSGNIFWLSAKVPSRSYFVNLIKTNGGQVVSLEKDAHICLVDDMRHDTYSSEVYSYKFIEDCVKNKRLEDLEGYLVSQKVKKLSKGGRPAAKSKDDLSEPATLRKHKSGRTPFTSLDDDILLEVLSRPGTKFGGNKVYQELERLYPHHTWHSWRSRWVDQLSKTMPNGPVPRNRVPIKGAPDEDDESDSPDEPVFTRQDDEILLKMKEEIVKAQNEKLVYRKIQKQNPQHSDIQWRNRFTNVILPKLNRAEVMSTPVQEGMEEDTSPPRSEQEALEEEEQALEPGLGDAVRLDEEIQESSKVSQESTPSPQPKPSEENVKKPGRSSQSLPDPHVQPHALGPGDRRRFSDIPNLKPTTPAHHDIPKGKPPPSPKGHPTKDLPISPDRPRRQSGERSDDVQRWRSEVQRHSSHTEDVLEETSEEIITTPPSPTHSPIKRKRLSEDISRRTTMIEHKRRRRSFIHEELREIPSTPERETSQRPLSPTLSNPGATVGSSMSAMQDFMKEEDEDENYDAVEDQQYKEESPVLSLHSDSSIVAINHIEEEGEVNLYDEELSPSNRAYRAREKGKRRQSDMGNGTETTLKREDTPEQSYYEEVHKRDEYTEVQEYVYAKAREYNVPETDVVEAIERTSGIRKLVEVVLQEFSQGRGLPEDMRGVWTLEDDQWLLDGDRRQRQAMEMKHGNVRERIEWLRMYNA